MIYVKLIDERTGKTLGVGDIVRSVDRGDLLAISSIEDAPESSPHPVIVTLMPFGEPFTAYAADDGELGGATLDGYWLV